MDDELLGHRRVPRQRRPLGRLPRLRPRGATGRHQSIESEIGIVLEGELTVESPTGRQKLGPGEVYWMPGLTPHDVRNEGARPAKLWDIFLKRCD